MRLLWTQWIYENKTSVNITTQPSDTESTDELPERIKTLIELVFTDYVNRRGLDRFYRDILLRLRRKEVDFSGSRTSLQNKYLRKFSLLPKKNGRSF